MVSCRQWGRGCLVAGMFVLGILIVAVIIPGFRLALGRRALRCCQQIVMEWNRLVCRILHLQIRITGEPDLQAGLTVANHISWLDIIAMGSLHPFLFVAKEDVAHWPVLGYLAKGVGTLFIRRGDARQATAVGETMTWLLRRGERLMLFPEGTTTRGDQVLRFHSKLLQPAQMAGTRVQAVALQYCGDAAIHAPFVGDDDFLPNLLKILTLEQVVLNLHYCPSLPAELSRDQLARASRRQITESLLHESLVIPERQKAVTKP